VALAQLEDGDFPMARLRQFVHALAEIGDRADLLAVLPPLPAGAPPPGPPVLAPKAYRRIIIRVLECRTSPRGERQRGRRYEIEVHTATCPSPQGGCCDTRCAECAPAAAGELRTEKVRTLDETTEAGLPELLVEEIEDILGVFGAEQPDLVQIMAPEALLPYLVFDAQIDRIRAWGHTQLFVLHPTVFSGECRSDRRKSGRYLLPRLPGPRETQEKWTGHCVPIQPAKDNLDLHAQLDGGDKVVAVTADRGMAEQCLYTPVPVVAVAWNDAVAAQAAIETVDCLRGLPRAMHDARQPLSLIYDTPQIPIYFAENEERVVVGN
jgi:hypothetical protein